MTKFYTNVTQLSGKICVRGYEDGQRFSKRIAYKPTLFVDRKDSESHWTTVDGNPVAPITFESVAAAREFVDKYKEVENFTIYGQTQFPYAYLAEAFPQDKIEWDINQLRIFNLDIEVASDAGFAKPENANQPITAISVMDKTTKQIIAFGCGDYVPHFDNIKYHKCENEHDLLQTFLAYWSFNYPDIVTGWNVKLYDIPYLVNRIHILFGEEVAKKMAPWPIRKKEVKGAKQWQHLRSDQTTYELGGIAILDYLDLYRKFIYTARESYSLNFICHVELKEEKLAYDEYDSLHDLYLKNFQKFMEYNTRDTWLVYRLEKKLRMLELAIMMAYDAKVNYEDIFSQVKFWETVIYNHLLTKKIAMPPKTGMAKREAYSGAYVKEPKPGLYKWVVSFDATSLYPSLILQYNISPDTLKDITLDQRIPVEDIIEQKVDLAWLKEQNIGMAANGVCFANDKQGFFGELVDKFFTERQMYKKAMLDAKKRFEKTKDPKDEEEAAKYKVYQEARKISLNSLYGAAGSPYFRFFSIRQAEAITLSGQMMIQFIEREVNDYFNKLLGNKEPKVYVVYGDTDSIYITLDDLVQKVFPNRVDPNVIVDFIDKVCKEKLSKVLDDACAKMATYSNAYRNAISFKRESITDSALWTGKKRYVMRVYDMEGVRYAEPEIKVTGLEVVRSSTPEVVRKMLKDAIKVILDDKQEKVWEFVANAREVFEKQVPEDIAFPRSVNGLDTYADEKTIYGHKTPMHVRASLLYNSLIVQHKLDKKYKMIQEGDKVKFLYLKEPNSLKENTIAFLSSLPKEFQLHRAVDYDTMFSKTFIEPVQGILDCLGWNTVKVNNLDELFE